MCNLATIFKQQYDAGHAKGLDEALLVARTAVENTRDNHPDKAACLAVLSDILRVEWMRKGQWEISSEAIDRGPTPSKQSQKVETALRSGDKSKDGNFVTVRGSQKMQTSRSTTCPTRGGPDHAQTRVYERINARRIAHASHSPSTS
jgi:hypothetical protein